MPKKILGSFDNLESFCFSLGLGMGSIIATLSREKSPLEYEEAIGNLGLAAEETGAPPELLALYRGALRAIITTNQADLDMGHS